MPRGRKKFHEDTTPWSVRLPTSLTAKVDLLLLDPLTGRVKYGARTQLTERLLRQWLLEQQQLFTQEGADAPGFEPDHDRYAGNRGPEDEPE